MKLILALVGALLLGACQHTSGPGGALPAPPADVHTCFNKVMSVVPARDLTQAEVESLWKSDRFKAVVMRQCGRRFVAWYDQLRAGWK